MENLNAEQVINELDYQIKFAHFTKSTGVYISAKCAQFALDNIKNCEQRIRELTAELDAKRLECEELIETGFEVVDYAIDKIAELTTKNAKDPEVTVDAKPCG